MSAKLFYVLSASVAALLFTGCTQQSTVQPASVPTVPEDPIAIISNGALLVTNDEQENVVRVNEDGRSVSDPVWFNDELSLMYVVAGDDFFEFTVTDLEEQETDFVFASQSQPEQIRLAPNNNHVLYVADEDLYWLDIEQKRSERLHEGVYSGAWSPDGKTIVYNTIDSRLLKRELTIDDEVSDAIELLAEDYVPYAPFFLNTRTVVFEGADKKENEDDEQSYAVLQLNLNDLEVTSLSSLTFSEESSEVSFALEPNGDRILYTRPDPETNQSDVWILDAVQDVPKRIAPGATSPAWSSDGFSVYYISRFSDDDNTLFKASGSGLNRAEIYSPVTAVAVPH